MVEVWAQVWVAVWALAAMEQALDQGLVKVWVLECQGNRRLQNTFLSNLSCRDLHFRQKDTLHKSSHHPIYSNSMLSLHRLQERWQELPTS
jgi:hypothetical protein